MGPVTSSFSTPVNPEAPSSAPFVMSAAPGPAQSMGGMSAARGSKSKKPLMAGLAAVLLVVAAATTYVFAFYLPNTPSNVFSSSLTNSGKALDTLISYTEHQQQANYKSDAVDGTVSLKSPSGSFDLNLNGAFDTQSNGTMSMNMDVMGQKVSANLRTVHVASSQSPDVYFQINGIKSYLDSNGLNSLDSLDGQWVSIDHTLIDTYESSIAQQLGTGGNSNTMTTPTSAQIDDAMNKVQVVNKQYIFTGDTSKSVLTNDKFLGTQTSGGRTLDHYQVGYNKAHLEAYVTALGNALDSSQLNAWSKQANGKDLSAVIDVNSMNQDVKSSSGNYTFDMWADTGTKLVSKLSFVDTTSNSAIATISQGYTGGSVYPFTFGISDKDSSGNPESGSLNLTVDTATNKVSGTFDYSNQASTGSTTASATFNLTPSNNSVSVTAPAGAKSINDVLDSLGLGGLLSPSSLMSQSSTPFFVGQ